GGIPRCAETHSVARRGSINSTGARRNYLGRGDSSCNGGPEVPPRRQRPLPQLDISLEALPPPESKRICRLALAFTEREFVMIEGEARRRGEQPAVFCRTLVLTGFHNSALRVLAEEPNLLTMSPAQQQRALL